MELIIKIKDPKVYDSLMRFLKSLNIEILKVEKDKRIKRNPDSKKEILKNTEKGFREIKLIEKGKLKSTPLKDFLNEL